MKKIALLLILFLYLVPAIGITVSAHFCGSRITWVSVNFEHQDHKCACGSKKMKTDCCKDNVAFIKLDNEQRHSSYDLNIMANVFVALAPQQGISFKGLCLSSQHITQLLCLPPPDNIKHPLYVHHCTFLI
jgi:hypothetical protein